MDEEKERLRREAAAAKVVSQNLGFALSKLIAMHAEQAQDNQLSAFAAASDLVRRSAIEPTQGPADPAVSRAVDPFVESAIDMARLQLRRKARGRG